jgi:hypothetical protein
MNYLDETKQYYANWLSVCHDLLNQNETFYLYSPERDIVQEGYSKPFDFYGYYSGRTVIISYGRKVEMDSDWIHEYLPSTTDLFEFKRIVKEKLGKDLHHDYKYYFTQLPTDIDTSKAKQLTEQDYPDYLDFFTTLYPNNQAETWLTCYFNEIASKGYVFGLFLGDKLVSASDSPSMPYLREKAVELGINTLPEYRNRGFAKIVLGAMLKFVISIQKVPIVSCSSSYIASHKLIQSVGFVKLADVISISL